MSNIIRKIKNQISVLTGIEVNFEDRKRNRAETGLPKTIPHRKSDSLIYGAQGSVFNNSCGPKAWQHGPHYQKFNTKGRFVDLTDRADKDGNPLYLRQNSGSLINVNRNRAKARLAKQMRKQAA